MSPAVKFNLFCFVGLRADEQFNESHSQARKFARAMKASLIFCSAKKGINVAKIFKAILTTTFRIKAEIHE
eukprot:837216-Amorphochlora_amoeboformis.AAC.3